MVFYPKKSFCCTFNILTDLTHGWWLAGEEHSLEGSAKRSRRCSVAVRGSSGTGRMLSGCLSPNSKDEAGKRSQ